LPELLEEFEAFEEFEEPAEPEPVEPELVEPELVEPELVLALSSCVVVVRDVLSSDVEVRDTPPVLDDVRLVPVTAACVEPGRETATAPAAATLAKPTVTVVAFRRRLPSSRSATACITLRAAPSRGARARGDPFRNSGLLMLVSLAYLLGRAVRVGSENALSAAANDRCDY